MIKTGEQLVQEVKSLISEASVEQLQQNINQGIVLIDVREPLEYEGGHIPQAVNIPRGILEMKLHLHPEFHRQEQPLEKMNGKDIYLICRTGARSALAAESLERLGFERVYSVAGGMTKWQQDGLEIVS